MAASRRHSRRSVMPEMAEWTMRTRAPPAARAAATLAMLFQFGRLETLLPPNLRTIQGEDAGGMATPGMPAALGAPANSIPLALEIGARLRAAGSTSRRRSLSGLSQACDRPALPRAGSRPPCLVYPGCGRACPHGQATGRNRCRPRWGRPEIHRRDRKSRYLVPTSGGIIPELIQWLTCRRRHWQGCEL